MGTRIEDRSGRSADAAPPEREFLEALRLYFRGEKEESLVILAGSGLLLAAAGGLVSAEPQPFARGLAGALLLPVVVGSVVGGTIVLRTDRQVADLTSLYDADLDRFAASEGTRMRKVVRSFRTYRIGYSVVAATALGLGWSAARPVLDGVAAGLLVFAGLGFVVDHFAEARAIRYEKEVLAQGASP